MNYKYSNKYSRIIVDNGERFGGRRNACLAASMKYAFECKGQFVSDERLIQMIDNMRGVKSKEFVTPILDDDSGMVPYIHPEVMSVLSESHRNISLFTQVDENTDVVQYARFVDGEYSTDAYDQDNDICIILVLTEYHWCAYPLNEEEDEMERMRTEKKRAAKRTIAIKKKATKKTKRPNKRS